MNRELVAPTLCALTVEVIRRCWDRGHLTDNKWARLIHDNWLPHWIDWKTRLVMQGVDAEVEELHELWDAQEKGPIFSETLEGETPLGGEMRLTSRHEEG